MARIAPRSMDLIAEARATIAHMRQVREELRQTIDRSEAARQQVLRDRDARQRAFLKQLGHRPRERAQD